MIWPNTCSFTGALKDIFFKTTPFLVIITFISKKIMLEGFVFSFCLIIVTLLLGRFFCGWICPLGTSIDITAALKKRHPELKDKNNALLRKVKFCLLGILVLCGILGKQVAWIFDPLVITERFVSLNLIPMLREALLGVKASYYPDSVMALSLFAAVCISSLVLQRLWCRALCPLGAIYAFFARLAPLRRTTEECTKCDRCKSRCRTGAIKDDLNYIQGECILCMDCVYDCTAHTTEFKFTQSRITNGLKNK